MTSYSGYCPTPLTLNQLHEGISLRLRSAIAGKESVIARHNAYTDYCLALLLCSTGHRPVRDPFSRLSHFDLDRGLLLVSDKVSDEACAWRLVALPELVVKQVRAYLDYLPRVAAWLQQNDPAGFLPQKILKLSRGGAGMPLFFLLDEQDPGSFKSITTSELTARWTSFWPLPVNFLRHVMATRLLQRSDRPDYVQLQLGHMEGVDYPLGQKTTDSVLQTLGKIGLHLDEVMHELGWRVVEARMRTPGSGPVRNTNNAADVDTNLFGHDLRAAERQKRQLKATELVRELAAEHFPKSSRAGRIEYEKLVQRLSVEAPLRGCSLNRCLRLLYRFIRTQRGGADLLRQVARVRQIEVEPSPFRQSALDDYRALTEVRQAFLGYLDENGRSAVEPPVGERLAEIICSAGLFGGVAVAARLQSLGAALLQHTYRYAGQLFVDLQLGTDGAVFRWFPDSLSSSLIEGLYRLDRSGFSGSSWNPDACVGRLIKLLGFKERERKPLEFLAAHAQAGLLLELPGYVASSLQGDVSAVSVPLAPWVRIVSGQALVDELAANGVHELADKGGWAPDIRNCHTPGCSMDKGRQFLGQLRGFVFIAREARVSGNERPSRRYKRLLAESLRQAGDESLDWAVLPRMLVGWAVYLCEFGTSFKKDIAFSTVEKYLFLVAARLLPAAAHQDISAFDDAEFERLYLRVVETESEHRRFELASRLREFHAFLVSNYWVDELDWSAVMAAAGGASPVAYADANYVTGAEYRDVLQTILRDEGLVERQRWQYAWLLMLGFRFGLRFGEAMRLQYRDVQRDDDEMHVWIHNTLHGETKTEASARVVSLLEQLSADEITVIENLLAAGAADFAEDPIAPLMCAAPASRMLINRYEAAHYLNTLLRQVTGDATIRFHHLRHGWVTRLVATQAGIVVPGFSDERLSLPAWKAFLGEGVMNYPLRSIMTAAGHADERTTIGSYTHCIDQLALEFPNTIVHDLRLSDFTSAYAQQIAHATIRRRRSRGEESGKAAQIPGPEVMTKPRTSAFFVHRLEEGQLCRPRLADVELFLRRYRETAQSVDSLAHNVGIKPVVARRILEGATLVEASTGYCGYDLTRSSSDPILTSNSVSPPKFFLHETARIKRSLEDLDEQLVALPHDELRVVASAVATWFRTFSARDAVCAVSHAEEVRAILVLANLLQVHAEGFVAAEGRQSEVQALMAVLQVPVVGPLPARQSTGAGGRAGIRLRSSDAIGPQRSLMRVLFLLATAFTSVGEFERGVLR